MAKFWAQGNSHEEEEDEGGGVDGPIRETRRA